jgi:hypothetical protein
MKNRKRMRSEGGRGREEGGGKGEHEKRRVTGRNDRNGQ